MGACGLEGAGKGYGGRHHGRENRYEEEGGKTGEREEKGKERESRSRDQKRHR